MKSNQVQTFSIKHSVDVVDAWTVDNQTTTIPRLSLDVETCPFVLATIMLRVVLISSVIYNWAILFLRKLWLE
jgi:hypothetical protein